jgi:adenylate kinase
MIMNIILIGPAGSGKGTQAKLISEHYKLPHISMGDLLRSEARKRTKQGIFVKRTIDAGNLVPDEMTVRVLKKRLKKKDCANGFILDGYPRNMNQVRLLGKDFSFDYAIYLKIPASVVIKRLAGRWQCRKCGAIYGEAVKPKKKGFCDRCGSALYQRDDDKEAAIRERLKVFKTLTEPMISHYRRKGVLHTVDAGQGVKKIFRDIRKIFR